jgi:hypothetical protein
VEPDRQEIGATYQIHEPDEPGKRLARAIALAFVVLVVVAAITITSLGVLRANGMSNSQAAQIHALKIANARLAYEVTTEQSELRQLSAKQTQMSARLASAASNNGLVTCNDLRHMNLTTTTGGSVSAVPGSVSLNQSAVSLPAHCRK